MSTSTHAAAIERHAERWKARAHAKQQWLERALEEPPKSADDAAWRRKWIKHALSAVKRGQTEVRHRVELLDVYAEHLSTLEMTLIAAAEQQPKSESQSAER
jgi:hypothetical protein